MGQQLDRSRKFATTYGEDARRYYQDGKYFDASGEEVASDPGPQRAAPPLGAGKPAGQVLPGAASTQVAAAGTTAPAVSEDEARAQLKGLNFGQIKKLFVQAGGPANEDAYKGAGSQARMIDWLVANRDKTAAADQQG